MSLSLSVECDPVDQPASTDPVERRTWSMLRIRIGGRTITRVWDKALQEERSFLYVPVFPIAEWVVSNWWALLNEPCRTEELPRVTPPYLHLPWIKRHCLRSAESGLLLPNLYLFNDGQGIRATWEVDEQNAAPNMLGEFVASGSDRLDVKAVEDALARFVHEVLGRVEGLNDDRVDVLKAQWRSIQSADADEATFCIASGRMGIDPYDPTEMSDTLASFIETTLIDPDLPVARDLTEVANAESVAQQWAWVQATISVLNLGPITKPIPIKPPVATLWPSQYGYQLARQVRDRAGLDLSAPVISIPTLAETVAGVPFDAPDHNHVPGDGIRAVVGWTRSNKVCVAGPRPPWPAGQRFLDARGLYHALFASAQSERLVTNAYTWDQQASRAFAAELLAPQSALTARTPGWANQAKVDELANEFQASSMLIKRQLGNAGVTLIED